MEKLRPAYNMTGIGKPIRTLLTLTKTVSGQALIGFIIVTGSAFVQLWASQMPDCLQPQLSQRSAGIQRIDIPLKFTGRVAIGDLNADNQVDFVIAGPNRLVAYDLCGVALWDKKASTNWHYAPHKYWYMTSYGFIGDVDGDGVGEFLHLGEDWRSLFVRDGATGEVEHELTLPERSWMYVLAGRRAGEKADQASRVFVVTPALNQDIFVRAYDFRGAVAKHEWSYHLPYSRAGKFAYVTPQAADLDGEGSDELLFAGLALDEFGMPIWLFNTSSISVGGMHMLSVKDIDPALPGLEVVISVYGPHRGEPALIGLANAKRDVEHWRAFSPHKERHPHQHAVGDFFPRLSGLETLARNNNGFDHWFADSQGNIIRRGWRVDPGWQWRGEYVQAIDWDETPGDEVLYVERHVSHSKQPRLRIISPITNSAVTPIFTARSNKNSIFLNDQVHHFNPFEASVHVVDLIGDGAEEVLAWGNNTITIFYNAANSAIPKKWGDADYMQIKKLFNPLYNPR